MATRLAWWTIPATVVVLVRVVTLETGPAPRVDATPPATVAASNVSSATSDREAVVLRDATGARRGPLVFDDASALVLQLPADAAGGPIDFTLRRYLPHLTAPSLWLHGRPQIRPDGRMPILGLPPGRYALEVAWGEDGAERRVARDVTVPGTIDLGN